jgi:ubiquinone/menaquinone biosynthesis C-methylase UbiE
MDVAERERDVWTQWLLQRRHGGDLDQLERQLKMLYPIRDRVLANARLREGETLLDIGCGDGLIGFGALEQVGSPGRVIFSDVSQDLLDHTRDVTVRMDIADRCQFVCAAAEDLAPIADASVDVVTTRSDLIYVGAKQRAFSEFYRVLRSGGRISLFEPINRFAYDESDGQFWGYDASPVQDISAKLRTLFHAQQPLDDDPMMNFDERDLLAYAERAGFKERHLEFRVDVAPHEPHPWETFVRMAFNPCIPTLAEAMAETLTPEESARFIAHMAPLIERGEGTFSLATAYLWAIRQ